MVVAALDQISANARQVGVGLIARFLHVPVHVAPTKFVLDLIFAIVNQDTKEVIVCSLYALKFARMGELAVPRTLVRVKPDGSIQIVPLQCAHKHARMVGTVQPITHVHVQTNGVVTIVEFPCALRSARMEACVLPPTPASVLHSG